MRQFQTGGGGYGSLAPCAWYPGVDEKKDTNGEGQHERAYEETYIEMQIPRHNVEAVTHFKIVLGNRCGVRASAPECCSGQAGAASAGVPQGRPTETPGIGNPWLSGSSTRRVDHLLAPPASGKRGAE